MSVPPPTKHSHGSSFLPPLPESPPSTLSHFRGGALCPLPPPPHQISSGGAGGWN